MATDAVGPGAERGGFTLIGVSGSDQAAFQTLGPSDLPEQQNTVVELQVLVQRSTIRPLG
jgi:hypothetical protein